jgi:hypothetical protein
LASGNSNKKGGTAMGAGNRKDREESRPSYEELEEWVRLNV